MKDLCDYTLDELLDEIALRQAIQAPPDIKHFSLTHYECAVCHQLFDADEVHMCMGNSTITTTAETTL